MSEHVNAPRRSRDAPPPILSGYRCESGTFDELLTPQGNIRPHYDTLIRGLDRMGIAELNRRQETARRLLHERSITYNVYGDPLGGERPWQMDPIPLLIAPEEWEWLSNALAQRATLINHILADCYGPQNLIRGGGLPAALLLGQHDFLRPCHGIRPTNDTWLHLYAADLARSPDGRWWVISDRTQIPSGAGYALANRLVVSHILPEPFRECKTHRLAGFFRDLQSALGGLARSDEPRVVLLTPGPFNETYFEQSYLARYLGYTLVEGQDLTVRDERLYLKTLTGLERVDVLLRRVDDDFCDPLELCNESMLGVPGLLAALRSGNAAASNALGTGLLQSPAFMAFLPALCRHILGEDLKIPSVATWWCGQDHAKEYVLNHIEDIFVKPAFRAGPPSDLFHPSAENADPKSLAERIRFRPYLYVGQEHVEFSTAPSIGLTGLVARPISLRVYLAATKDGYKAMPGGLARVASSDPSASISMQRGGSSKDVWVLSRNPVERVTLLQTSTPSIELRRVGTNLPSRMADNFFWLGRYAERADASARTLRSALIRLGPESGGTAAPLLAPLLETLEIQGQMAVGTGTSARNDDSALLEAEAIKAIFDPDRPGSLRNIALNLHRLGMSVRDRTSSDLWKAIDFLHDQFSEGTISRSLPTADVVALLTRTLLDLAAFHGLARENMTRAQGWRFLDMGVRIERSIYLCTLLERILLSPECDNPSVLETALEVANSTLTYRSRYSLLPNCAAVFDLILLDPNNPRSLLFQFDQLAKHLDRLPKEKNATPPSPAERILIEWGSALRLLDLHELNTPGSSRANTRTANVLRGISLAIPELSHLIATRFFAHSNISRTGGGIRE